MAVRYIYMCNYAQFLLPYTLSGADRSYLYTVNLLYLEYSSSDRATDVELHFLPLHIPLVLSS